MSQVVTQTRARLLALVGALVLALACAAVAVPSSAYAAYNSSCVINAYAQNSAMGAWTAYTGDILSCTSNTDTLTEAGQYIDVTVTFGDDISGVSDTDLTTYLQDNITIYDLNIGTSAYPRTVSLISRPSDYSVRFWISNRTDGSNTANYTGKLVLAANSSYNDDIATAMDGNSGETLIQSGISITKDTANSTSTSAVFTVDSRSKNRMMVHILATDVADGTTSAIFTGTTGVNGNCLVIHAHSFTTLTKADYASDIQTKAAAATQVNGGYSFAVSGNTITVTRTVNGSAADVSNVVLQVYDGSYLNTNQLGVGSITEGIYTGSN